MLFCCYNYFIWVNRISIKSSNNLLSVNKINKVLVVVEAISCRKLYSRIINLPTFVNNFSALHLFLSLLSLFIFKILSSDLFTSLCSKNIQMLDRKVKAPSLNQLKKLIGLKEGQTWLFSLKTTKLFLRTSLLANRSKNKIKNKLNYIILNKLNLSTFVKSLII